MVRNTHKSKSKKSGSARKANKLTSLKPKGTKSPESATKRNGVAQNGDDLARHVEKANAHLLKFWQSLHVTRTGGRKAT
jgi:hypothetical protein